MMKLQTILLTLLSLCFLSMGAVVKTPAIASEDIQTEGKTLVNVSHDLAKEVLATIGIPQTYDLYLRNSIDIGITPEMAEDEALMAWFDQLFVEEAGWSYVEAIYIAQLEANFSEAELRELVELVKNPLIQRLVKTEIEAYGASTEQRRKLFFQLWENYNSGQFSPPPDTQLN